jgi:hypothetical protein
MKNKTLDLGLSRTWLDKFEFVDGNQMLRDNCLLFLIFIQKDELVRLEVTGLKRKTTKNEI